MLAVPQTLASAMLVAALTTSSARAQVAGDFIVPSGQTLVYDTAQGPLQAHNFVIEPAAELRVVGPRAFVLEATGGIVLDGVLDLSGFDRPNVATLSTGNQPEVGAAGAAGGGSGGVGSFLTTTSTPAGGVGFGSVMLPGGGGRGGEAGFGVGPSQNYRGAGGGGGALGPALPGQGLGAEPGTAGGAGSQGAVSGLTPAQGGAPGPTAFPDGDPTNDFWGVAVDPVTGAVTLGELLRPRAGTGGGAGGDGVETASFPPLPWTPATDKKGCGGGGGGGLALMRARFVTVGPGGRVVADGGAGGSGEVKSFLDSIGGGSGGGSGGMLVLQAGWIDLSLAGADCFSAVGGAGGPGSGPGNAVGAGGAGGPGLVQLHLQNPANLILPATASLADLSRPDAHVLRPVL